MKTKVVAFLLFLNAMEVFSKVKLDNKQQMKNACFKIKLLDYLDRNHAPKEVSRRQ